MSFLKNLKSWVKGATAPVEPAAEASTLHEAPVGRVVPEVAPPAAVIEKPVALKVEAQAAPMASSPAPARNIPAPPPPPPAQRPAVEPEVEKTIDLATLYQGPPVKLVTRGAKVYGVCPHCEAMWSVRERLQHPSFRRQNNGKGLTCPGCDNSVGLPPGTDLRKLL